MSAALALVAEELPSTRTPPIAEKLAVRPGVAHEDRTIPGPAGAPDLVISIFKRKDHQPGGPGIYHTHGGGMIIGDRFTGIDVILEWVELMDAVCVTVEYRLAPEHPDPALVNDCYAGLVWTAEHADELGFDTGRLIVAGASAGGGLCAGVALLARDKGGPALAGQVLVYPMIDDRNQTVSSYQIDGFGVWDRGSNDTGWDAYLGDRQGTDRVSIYAPPSRATDLSFLPPAFIDVGSAKVFRDEAVAYASQIWADGGIAELHVWPGGFHGFDVMAPRAALSQAMPQTRTNWVRRLRRGRAVRLRRGYVSGPVILRVDDRGIRGAPIVVPALGNWPEHSVAGGARAWIERSGPAHANDAMILERLAVCLSITLERSAPVVATRRAVETVIDRGEPLEHRLAAAVRLRIDARLRLRVIAQPADEPVGDAPHSTVVVTAVGAIRAVIGTGDYTSGAHRAGFGIVGNAANLDRSWASALLALRLTSDRTPALDAEQLGGLRLLAEAADLHAESHPDRTALQRAIDDDRRTLATVSSLPATESLRAAAIELGVHHSTLRARVAELSAGLGYDIRKPAGRTRLSLALSLYLLATNRFDPADDPSIR
ncbi:MAG: alpha/beta hydrolase [Nakamurella sp.]